MTNLLFRDDAYLRSTSAKVIDVLPDGAILLDQTVFYATSGGQPGDSGALIAGDAKRIVIALTWKYVRA